MRVSRLKQKSQRGLAMVEFSISMLVVLFLMMVAVELGRLLFSYTILTQQVRAGARYASINALSPALVLEVASVRAETQQVVVTGQTQGGAAVLNGLTTSDVTVNGVFPAGASKPHVIVSASYTYTPIFPVIPTFWGGADFAFNNVLNSSTTMRAIR